MLRSARQRRPKKHSRRDEEKSPTLPTGTMLVEELTPLSPRSPSLGWNRPSAELRVAPAVPHAECWRRPHRRLRSTCWTANKVSNRRRANRGLVGFGLHVLGGVNVHVSSHVSL